MSNKELTSIQTPLQHLQSRFAIIDLSGAIRVVDQLQIQRIKEGTLKSEVSFYQKNDANIMMSRYIESCGLPCQPRRVIEDFWKSEETHQYDCIAFNPRSTPHSTLNFWVGHLTDPSPGNWVCIRDYLLEVVCNYDKNLFDYLTSYLAHMVQFPEEKPGVMIVLLGGQGTGKGIFFTLLRAIWPQTTLQVSKIDQVVGRFTAAMERNFIICMDEALFAGDRKAIDNLKSIVTEHNLHIEQKFQPSRTIESVHRMFAASNHEHFAHVESDDRRFLFIRVSEKRQQDTYYFSSLVSAISNPQIIRALIYYLKRRDITKFNIRSKPKTKEQTAQKIKSLQGFERFWYEVLSTGNLTAGCNPKEFWTGCVFIPSINLLDNYRSYNKAAEKYQTIQISQIQEVIKRICPRAITNIRETTTDKFNRSHQRRGVRLPTLEDARKDFSKHIGEALVWDEFDS